MDSHELESLGNPDLQIAGLRIWIHGRECPESADYWDGNWLRVTAYCVYPASIVRAHGALIHLGEIVGLLQGIERLYRALEGSAALDCMEPNLNVQLTARTCGHIAVELSITPDHMTQVHRFTDEIDQTYLPPIIATCRQILEKFPLREADRLPHERIVQQSAIASQRPVSFFRWFAFWRRKSRESR